MYDSKLYKAVETWSEREDLWEDWRKLLNDLEIPKSERLKVADQFYKQNEAEMLRGTKVLWPEKEPYVDLMKELVEGGRRAFMKEKQNEPLGSDDKVFTRYHWYRETEQRDAKGNWVKGLLIEESNVFVPLSHCRAYAAMDPSTGQKKARVGRMGDFTCLLTGLTDPKGRLFVHRDWTKRQPPSEYIKQIFIHHEEWKYEKVGVESNLYRNLLLPNIIAARREIEKQTKKLIQLALYDIETIENKEKRIYTLEPKVTNGYILLNRALSQEFFNQLDEFPKADHDDCPDALEMLWGMINNKYAMTPVGMNVMGGR
jgi:predicted phage terminase large subunit-like protein